MNDFQIYDFQDTNMISDLDQHLISKRGVSALRDMWKSIFGHSHTPSRRTNVFGDEGGDDGGGGASVPVLPSQPPPLDFTTIPMSYDTMQLVTRRGENGEIYGAAMEGQYTFEERWPTPYGDIVSFVVSSLSIPVPENFLRVIQQPYEEAYSYENIPTDSEAPSAYQPISNPPSAGARPKIAFGDRTLTDDKRRVDPTTELNYIPQRK